jgi:hypothetical protein
MKKTLSLSLLVGAVVLAAMLFGTAAQAQSIGIQFVGGGGSGGANTDMGPNEMAGAVVVQSHWNPAENATNETATGLVPIPLTDSTGAVTTATLEFFASANTWSNAIADMPGDARLMRGYLDSTTTSGTVAIITGVPYASYDVYLYTLGDTGEDRQGAYFVSTLATRQTTFDPANSIFTGVYIAGQNYTVFHNQHAQTLMVLAQGDQTFATTSGIKRAPLNGIQIVNTGTD